MVCKYQPSLVDSNENIKQEKMTSAEKCSFRNNISVDKKCLRKNRAVRYEMCPINNCVPNGTQRKMNGILLPIYHPYTGFLLPSFQLDCFVPTNDKTSQ